ncbi:MAG: hypothetical protein KDK70_29935 [Myxococcales bacterium]|nr:hypothetical protein [Myxococcales bacterium]
MCPPPQPRSSRAVDPEGNLAVQLPDAAAEPEPAENAEAAGLPEEPVPAPDGDELDEDLDEDPIAQGLVGYLDATPQQQEAARAGLQDRIAAHLQAARARVVVTDNLQTMLSIKRGRGGVFTFRLHHMFLRAPASVVRAVARYAQTHDREAAALLHAYANDNEALIRRPEQSRALPLDTQGRYHNLQEIFDDLNARYFDGCIEARITWGKRSKRRRDRASIGLGQYVFDDKLIRVHPVLDAEDVPRYFVESIVFHEMLHEVHGPATVDGRRLHHPPEFLRDEQRFEHHLDAVIWERQNSHKLLDR